MEARTIADKINVEEFNSWLIRQKTTRALFRWDCTDEEAYALHRAEETKRLADHYIKDYYDIELRG